MVGLPLICPRSDLGLELCNQFGGVSVASVGPVSQTLEQRLQEKEVAKGKGLVLTRGRHVTRSAVEGGKDFLRRFFEVSIEIGRERGRPALAIAAAIFLACISVADAFGRALFMRQVSTERLP
jgi:hypothetical protein